MFGRFSTKIALITFVAVAMFMVGCKTQSPTQKYRSAVQAYDGAVSVATVAINNDWVDLETAETMGSLEGVAYNRLVAMRDQLRADPDAELGSELDQVLEVIRALKALAGPAPPEGDPSDLPLPSRP